MRIVSGYLRGRKINPPKNLDVRPTTDLAKESLFNILQGYVDFDDIAVLDLFSGTGNISLEFVSRGVPRVVSVDSNGRCIRFLKEVTQQLGVENISVFREDVFRFIKYHKQTYNLIFADPPYNLKGLEDIPRLLLDSKMIHEDTLIILEHPAEYDFKEYDGFLESRRYSRVNFSFFRKKNSSG